MKPKRLPKLFIGLMSGTSADAIDAALVEIGQPIAFRHVKVLDHHQRPWPARLRRKLHSVMEPASCSAGQIAILDMLTAREFAAAALELLSHCRIPAERITAIGTHGQTIAHMPPEKKGRTGATLQIGSVPVIATLTGICTVGNFRPADMAMGGQGAPLVPAVDAILFADSKLCRSIHNIGGISNLTWLPPKKRGKESTAIAFDTGPGNCLIDSLAQNLLNRTCDRDGRIARSGHVNATILDRLLRNPYLRRRPPKSTGRELFGAVLAEELIRLYPRARPQELIATATELTAYTIADAYRRLVPSVPDEIIFCGGGVNNIYLMERITHHLDFGTSGRPNIQTMEAFGIRNAAREAMCFAVLAAMTLDGIPGNLPSCTGAQRRVVLGTTSRSHPDPSHRYG